MLPASRATGEAFTLREALTLVPEAFAALLKDTQASTAAGGLIARAATRSNGQARGRETLEMSAARGQELVPVDAAERRQCYFAPDIVDEDFRVPIGLELSVIGKGQEQD